VPCDVRKDSCRVSALWQEDCQDVDGWKSFFKSSNGIAIKLGEASGGLMVADVDQKHDQNLTLSDRFLEAMKYMLPDCWDDFYIEETRSGGLHIFFRVDGMPAKAKEVPARTIEYDENGKETQPALIEILGEGQIVFTHPTPLYQIKQGSIEEIPTISKEDYDELIKVCRSFNELPDQEVEAHQEEWGLPKDEGRPGDLFNRNCDPHKFASWLQGKGWKIVKKMGEKYWFRRPRLQSDETFSENKISATWNHDGRRLFICFSDNAGFKTKRIGSDGEEKVIGHQPFAVYAKLQCDGNFKKAAKDLVDAGFVNPDDWDEVQPLETVKANPFDLDSVLPESCEMFKRYISEVADSFQVHPEMVLFPAMSIASLAVCASARVKINEDWVEDAPIWTIVVAKASERKSPTLKELMTPVDDFIKRFRYDNRSAIGSLKRRHMGLKARLEALEADFKKGCKKGADVSDLDTAISLVEQELEQMGDIVDMPDLFLADATPESVVHGLKQSGETVGIITAEAEPIENALGLYSDKPNFSIYLKGFSCERYISSRVTSGKVTIEEPRIVLSVLMQNEPMEKLAESRVARERGFIGRCFFAVPQSKVGERELVPPRITPDTRASWKNLISRLMAMPHKNRLVEDGNGGVILNKQKPVDVELSEDAQLLLLQARMKNEEALAAGGELDESSGWGGKLMGNICRLALTLHFIGGGSLRNEISGEVMQAALAWVDPLTEHYYAATGHIGEGQMDKVVHQTMKNMIQKGLIEDGKRVVEIAEALRSKRKETTRTWQPIFDRMQELGFIRIVDGQKPKNGPAPKLMKFHPNFVNLVK